METTNVKEYQWSEAFKVTKELKDAYEENGYIMVRNLLTKDEVELLTKAVEENEVERDSFTRPDGEGGHAQQCQWYHLYDDITGAICRSEKVAGTFEELLGGAVYPYHMKFTLKKPLTGGAWVWHQDYGYWYEDGCLVPTMGTVYIAIDSATKENGCLKILVGSHKAGRISHVAQGGQVGADMERVQLLVDRFPLLHAEMSAGDGLFFHANMLHRSDSNKSTSRRWGFVASYNRTDNGPCYTGIHGSASPYYMEKVPNSAILASGTKLAEKTYWMNKGKDAETTFSKVAKLHEK